MIKILSQWLLPAACVLCGDFTHTDLDLCAECYAELPLLENSCLQCGLPLQQIPSQIHPQHTPAQQIPSYIHSQHTPAQQIHSQYIPEQHILPQQIHPQQMPSHIHTQQKELNPNKALDQYKKQDRHTTEDQYKKQDHHTTEDQYKKQDRYTTENQSNQHHQHKEQHQQEESAQQHCGNCLKNPPPYDRMIALCRYQEPIDSFITALKFNGQLCYAQLLGKLLANQLSKQSYHGASLPKRIIPIPLHHQRLRERGFNQALEIARPIAKLLDIPILHNACVRQHATQSQALIHATQRRQNLRNAFAINQQIDADHIAIIDDVVTTGSTVAELSNELRQFGVKKIDIWCCARTVLNMPTL